MSGLFLGPPSLSQERIHGVTANSPSHDHFIVNNGPIYWTHRSKGLFNAPQRGVELPSLEIRKSAKVHV